MATLGKNVPSLSPRASPERTNVRANMGGTFSYFCAGDIGDRAHVSQEAACGSDGVEPPEAPLLSLLENQARPFL